MEMAQGQIIKTGRKGIRTHRGQGTHIEITDPVAFHFAAASGEEMTHPDDRHGTGQLVPLLLGFGADLAVMLCDPQNQIPLPIIHVLPGCCCAYLPVAEKGHCADDGLGFSGLVLEDKDLLGRGRRQGGENVNIKGSQEFSRCAEKGGGVVIARSHHQMSAGRGRHPAEEIVVELLGPVAGGGGVEDVACHQEDVHLLLDNGVVEPVEKGGELGVAMASVEGSAYVPV